MVGVCKRYDMSKYLVWSPSSVAYAALSPVQSWSLSVMFCPGTLQVTYTVQLQAFFAVPSHRLSEFYWRQCKAPIVTNTHTHRRYYSDSILEHPKLRLKTTQNYENTPCYTLHALAHAQTHTHSLSLPNWQTHTHTHTDTHISRTLPSSKLPTQRQLLVTFQIFCRRYAHSR